MTKPRKLAGGDRVEITGAWKLDTEGNSGEEYIGRFATVDRIDGSPGMSVRILIDESTGFHWYWCRENLRALPRKEPDER